MRWRPDLLLSAQARHIALGVAVVLLPLSVLAVMQYRSMVDLEAKTKVAVKENLRQTLQSVERKMEGRFEQLARDTLLPIAEVGKEEQEDKEGLERLFVAALGRHREIAQLLLISQCACRAQQEHRGYLFTHEGLRSIDSSELHLDAESHDALRAFEKARLLGSHVPKSGQEFLFWQTSCPSCAIRSKDQRRTYIFRAVLSPITREPIGFAAMVFNTAYVEKHFLAQNIPEVLQSPELALADSSVALAIFDEAKTVIYANTKETVQSEVTTEFSRPFSQWEMGIGLKETTIGALARSNFQKNLLLTLLTLAFLILGLSLILRATARDLKLAQAKSEFVSNVSHELKTPLTMIRLFAEILSLGRVKNAEKAQEYYRIIENESSRLSQLIDNILDFSTMEAGRKNYRLVESHVPQIVEGVVQSYEYQMINSGFELRVEFQPNLPAILVDPDAIAQAVLNLLNNAVKYSDKIKMIAVRVFQASAAIGIEVSDSGIGIPRSEHQKIFEKFHRVGTALVHNTKGSGLGLSLVKHIVEAHRGQILVESVPGEGSRFTILLPLSEVTGATENERRDAGGYEFAKSFNN